MTAGVDNSGVNTGNWTAIFDKAVVGINYNTYEVYKMVVELNPSAGVVSWTIHIGQRAYEGYQSSVIATWSDPNPMVVDSGETVYFYFSEPTSDGTPPVVTLWCQVDDSNARIS